MTISFSDGGILNIPICLSPNSVLIVVTERNIFVEYLNSDIVETGFNMFLCRYQTNLKKQ